VIHIALQLALSLHSDCSEGFERIRDAERVAANMNEINRLPGGSEVLELDEFLGLYHGFPIYLREIKRDGWAPQSYLFIPRSPELQGILHYFGHGSRLFLAAYAGILKRSGAGNALLEAFFDLHPNEQILTTLSHDNHKAAKALAMRLRDKPIQPLLRSDVNSVPLFASALKAGRQLSFYRDEEMGVLTSISERKASSSSEMGFHLQSFLENF